MADYAGDFGGRCLFTRALIPEAYYMKSLTEIERQVFERHLRVCFECTRAVKIGTQIRNFMKLE